MSMNILVTGASGGMGFSTCQQLVASGYTVYVLDRQQPDGSYPFRFLRADTTDSALLAVVFKRISHTTQSSADRTTECIQQSIATSPCWPT
ncbi:SDR family NAD(P)-dependent oxidoreductase [uncultured Sphaerochaeta sp.]|uniref:SDR family NAD(P)-dependent oxidoreductase n=1 Tax=uncultured Sphaerochaeta sp. TaxID=886478 RepID=UPI0029C9F7E0|nr:SDR family NAD(P)-dependent oxidoreductase [uncultured Sphaerochaeta sp.]